MHHEAAWEILKNDERTRVHAERFLSERERFLELKRDLRTPGNIDALFETADKMLEAKRGLDEHVDWEEPVQKPLPRYALYRWDMVYVGLLITSLAFFAKGFGLF